jgi:hypothetical protein
MNWKLFGRKVSLPNLNCYPGICLDGLSKVMKKLTQGGETLGQDLNKNLPDLRLESWSLDCDVQYICNYGQVDFVKFQVDQNFMYSHAAYVTLFLSAFIISCSDIKNRLLVSVFWTISIVLCSF